MNGKKFYLAMLLSFVMVFSSCAKSNAVPQNDDKYDPVPIPTEPSIEEEYVDPNAIHIGVSMQGLQREYIRRVRDVMLDAAEEYKGAIKLTILDGQEDAERQNAQIEKFITQGVDAIIFNPISYDEGEIGVQLANRNGIPIVMLITTVNNGLDLARAYAVSDHKESAYIQMDMAAKYLDYEGKIAVLKGKKGIESEIGRTQGYEDKLQEYPNIELECSQVANWSTDESREIVENWIRTGKEFDAVLAQNDIMAIGALQAIKEAGKLNEIAVFGIDGDAEALRLVKKGQMKGTVYHDAITQGRTAIQYAVMLARGEEVECDFIPFKAVDNSNVDYYLSITE